jgi:hypothetical protein
MRMKRILRTLTSSKIGIGIGVGAPASAVGATVLIEGGGTFTLAQLVALMNFMPASVARGATAEIAQGLSRNAIDLVLRMKT